MFKVMLCIATQHDWWLVLVAALVCIPATAAAFFLYSRVPTFPMWRRWAWLAMTGIVAGSGIWTTHFVGMLAFKTGLPTGYAALGTFGSLAVAVASTTIGFAIGSSRRDKGQNWTAIVGGLIVGIGITLMHYVGMMGYRTAGTLQWAPAYVAGSVLIGAAFAAAALFVARPGSALKRQAAGAALLSLGIVGMHFTGMTAVTIVPDASVTVPASLMSDAVMVALAVASTAVILITAIGGVAFDTASRNGNLRRLREALDVMPEGLAFYDSSDRLVAWNTQYEDLCSMGGATLTVGMPFLELLETNLVHGVYPDATGREREWLAERRAARWDPVPPNLTQQTSGGRWLRVTERRTADGGTVSVSVDITDLKRAETAMDEARAEAEAAAHVKSEFLANMSHELRTPLTSIIGFTGLAVAQSDLTELTRTYVERVAEASRALLCTVNDILDFSKLEAGQATFHVQPICLAKLGRATLDLFTPQAGSKDISLTLDIDADELVIAVDPDRIRQILLNLVGNAVKFTAAGGVTLKARYDRAGQTLSVDVIDTGEGVSAEKQDRLFKRFSQVDGSLTRNNGGTGLGLAICKGLVEAMGGRIGVDSRIGEGSRFWFEIPAALANLSEGDGAATPDDPLGFAGVQVLVADDHPANRELARLFLAGIGAQITEAVDGEEAVRLAAAHPYDVILMDIRMPRLDGPAALRRIHDDEGPNARTPILAFSADADQATVERLIAAGFYEVVAKPMDPGSLITAVARATAAGQATQDLADVA